MTALALKKEITNAIMSIKDEAFLQALHTIVKNKNAAFDFEFNDDEKKLLDQRKSLYKSGKIKTYTPAQVKKKLMRHLSA